MYRPAMRLEAQNGRCEVLAEVVPPYFNRTYGHYCGHKNTPYNMRRRAARPLCAAMALCMRPIHWEPFIKCTAASIIAGILNSFCG